jgi:phage antirepressor YoqD-like protein/predicted transcriptional regulator
MKTTNLLKEIREPKGANLTAVNLTTVTEPRVTTRELAENLGVDVSTIKKTVKRLEEGGEILHYLTKDKYNNDCFLFDEKQATIIKNEISKHHNLASRQIDNVSTDYEMELLTQKVMAYHIQKANEYKQRAELAEKTLNRISDGKGCFTMNQAAKALKLPYGNITLYKNLKTLNILNVDNTPRQEQVNNGNFKVVVKFINDTVGNKSVTLVTSKGLVFLAKKLNTTIDESIKADYED